MAKGDWHVTIDYRDQGTHRFETDVPTPTVHVAVDTALFRAGLSSAKDGEYQITVTRCV